MGKKVKKTAVDLDDVSFLQGSNGAAGPEIATNDVNLSKVVENLHLSTDNENASSDCLHFRTVNVKELKKSFTKNILTRCHKCLAPAGKSGQKKLKILAEKTPEPAGGVWICITCGIPYCSHSTSGKHIQGHASGNPKHSIAINSKSFVCWCFACDHEIALRDPPDPRFEQVDEAREFLRRVLTKTAHKVIEIPAATVHANGDTMGDGDEAGSVMTQLSKASSVSVKGLQNLGNTCFFNAIMQSLSETPPWVDHFCEDGPSQGEEGLLTGAVRTFMRAMHGVGMKQVAAEEPAKKTKSKIVQKNIIAPKSLFSEISRKASIFRGHGQQDSQELIRYLLDGIRTEEVARLREAECENDGAISTKKSKASKKAPQKGSEKPKQVVTIVDQVFGGTTVSNIICHECGHVSKVSEAFLDLSLSIPSELSSNAKANQVALKTKKAGNRSLIEWARSKTHKVISKGNPTEDSDNEAIRSGPDEPTTTPHTDSAIDYSHDSDVELRNGEDAEGMNSSRNASLSLVVDSQGRPIDADVNSSGPKFHRGYKKKQRPTLHSLLTGGFGARRPVSEAISGDALQDVQEMAAQSVSSAQLAAGPPDRRRAVSCEELVSPSKADVAALGEFAAVSKSPRPVSSMRRTQDKDDGKKARNKKHDDVKHNGNRDEDHGVDMDGAPENERADSEPIMSSPVTSSHLLPYIPPDAMTEWNLRACLYSFIMPEILTGSNSFLCDECTKRLKKHPSLFDKVLHKTNVSSFTKNVPVSEGVRTAATKVMMIEKPPAILTIHLKRFMQIGKKLEKNNKFISFPLSLDLSPFIARPPSEGLPKRHDGVTDPPTPVVYTLYAVVCHVGRLNSGHYTSYIKKGELPFNDDGTPLQWYFFSDQNYRKASVEEVLKCEAYMLFYKPIHEDSSPRDPSPLVGNNVDGRDYAAAINGAPNGILHQGSGGTANGPGSPGPHQPSQNYARDNVN